MEDERYELASEPSFSWAPCECCGSSLGGDRYPAHGIDPDDANGSVVHLDVCADCLMYLANGDEPENRKD